MDRKLLLSILGLSLMVIGVLIVLPGGRPVETEPRVPWRIQTHPDGSSTVFTLTLGQSTLADARRVLGDTGSPTLFEAKDGRLNLEVFFEQAVLAGLRADFIFGLVADQEHLRAMHDRGSRSAKMGSGERKITLGSEDDASLGDLLIRHITYLPMADLDAKLLESRFGTPAERLPDPGGDLEHWLYPERGLDISVSAKRKEVFQYVAPKDFDSLAAPLRAGPPASN